MSMVTGQTPTEGTPPADPAAPPADPAAQKEGESGDGKPPAGEAPAPEPLTVEGLTIPEGMTLDSPLATEFVELMNNGELSAADRANALLQLQAKALTAASEASSAAWTTMQNEWRDAVKAEFGDKLQPTLDSINNLVTEYGDKDLVEALAVTGAGNNVHVVKFFGKLAGLLTEGKFAPSATPADGKSAAQRLFPSAN